MHVIRSNWRSDCEFGLAVQLPLRAKSSLPYGLLSDSVMLRANIVYKLPAIAALCGPHNYDFRVFAL